MKTATIFAIASNNPAGYSWVWHCSFDGAESASPFEFYYDCLSDAREHGCKLEPKIVRGLMAPGAASYPSMK